MNSQRELARLLAKRDRVPTGASVPQLSFSSIEDGSIKEYDTEGHLVSEVGKQWDGSHGAYPLTGPTPPRPTAPTVEGGTSATISWDGTFLGGDGLVDLLITAPMDWSRVELHISKVQGFRADTAATLVDTIETPRGGSRPALPGPGTWYAVLVARSLAGKRGEQSPETQFEVVPGLTEADVQELRDEFGEITLDLNRALQENVVQQNQLGQRVDTLRDTTLPALEDELTEAQNRLDQVPSQIAAVQQAAVDAATLAVEELISTGQSVITNGNFEAGMAGWQGNAGGVVIPEAARSGSLGMRLTPNTGNAWPVSDMVPTAPGRKYHLEMWVRRTGVDTWSTESVGFIIQTKDEAGVWDTRVAKLYAPDGTPLTTGQISDVGFTKVTAEVVVEQTTAVGVSFAPWFYQTPDNVYDVDDFVAVDITAVSLQVDQAKAEAIAKASQDTSAQLERFTLDLSRLTVTETAFLNEAVARRMAANVGEFVQLSTDQLVAGSASIGTGVADKFFADVFGTRKLNANQVFIGEGGNLFPAEFNDPGWQPLTGATFSATGGKSGGSSLLMPVSTAQIGTYYGIAVADRAKAPRLIPGESYRIAANVRGDKAIVVGGAALFVRLYTLSAAAGTYTWATTTAPISNTAVIAANTWGEIGGEFTVPDTATATYAVIGVYSEAKNTTSALRFSDLKIQLAITPSLIVDGFFQGLRVVGASIETNTAASRGVKMSDAGLFAYSGTGVETLRFDGTNSIITGATVRTAASGARIQMSSVGLEGWDASNARYLKADSTGLELRGTISSVGVALGTVKPISVVMTTVPRVDAKDNKAYANPGLIFNDGTVGNDRAAGVYSLDGVALTLAGRSDPNNFQGNGQVVLDSAYARMWGRSVDIGQRGSGDLNSTQAIQLLGRNITIGAEASAITNLRGYLRMNGVPLEDSGWEDVSMLNGWVNYGNGFARLKSRRSMGIAYLSGTIKGGVRGTVFCRLPVGQRPIFTESATTTVEFPITVWQGTTCYPGSAWVNANGEVKYDALPGVWSGSDRVIIYLSFPVESSRPLASPPPAV